ncbi:MAG TPA: hypothetical protein VHA74_00135 [Candidatus Dojkabacteria bacterium]|nr:hypothetical protein [Candidatus Dojkabacteria bacterium]
MLKNLFVSKVRIEILEYYFTHPNEEFHVRALVRALKEEINAVRRELINLEKSGILKSERKNNKLIYTINPTSPFLEELKSMIYKDSELGQRIYKMLPEVGNIETVILTYAFIQNKYDNSYDVDLLFIGTPDIRKLASNIKEIEKDIHRELRYSVISKQDYNFAKKKMEPFLMNIVQKDYILIVGTEKALNV